jgi:endonuclease YncB( thermonuclease family)
MGAVGRKGPFLCLLALIVLVGSSPAEEFSGKVVGISDGDTITVLRDRSPVKVRLYGIDCPELGQEFGSRAKSVTSELTFGQVVGVRKRDTDRYGRTVADIVLPDGRILNHELVRQGFAWWYRRYAPNDVTLARLEAEARAARRGLWSEPHPVPPWVWRRPKRDAAPTAEGTVIGNRRTFVYHRPGCPNAARVSQKNQVTFGSPAAAERAGYRPGKDCH